MVVVSNSSVLINLVLIGRLELLNRKFGEVIIPQAVWREVVVDGTGKPGAKEVEQGSRGERAEEQGSRGARVQGRKGERRR